MNEIRVDDEITLKRASAEQAEEQFALIDASREHLRRWLRWVDETTSVDDQREWLRERAEEGPDGEQTWLVFYEGRMAGTIGMHGKPQSDRVEIGYWLGARYEGRGIMTRACKAVVDYAFAERGIHCVRIRAARENLRSRAIPERLGFVQEGVERDGDRLLDGYHDMICYSLLEHEWRSRKKA